MARTYDEDGTETNSISERKEKKTFMKTNGINNFLQYFIFKF